MSLATWNPSPFNQTALFGERPASWRRRGFISPIRTGSTPAGSIPTPLRYPRLDSRLAALLSLSLIHSDSVSSARSAASLYVSCSGSATRIVRYLLGAPSGSSFGLPRVSIKEVYQQKTFPQADFAPCDSLYCWYNKRSDWELCPNKKPRFNPARLNRGNNNPATSARWLRYIHSVTQGRPSQRELCDDDCLCSCGYETIRIRQEQKPPGPLSDLWQNMDGPAAPAAWRYAGFNRRCQAGAASADPGHVDSSDRTHHGFAPGHDLQAIGFLRQCLSAVHGSSNARPYADAFGIRRTVDLCLSQTGPLDGQRKGRVARRRGYLPLDVHRSKNQAYAIVPCRKAFGRQCPSFHDGRCCRRLVFPNPHASDSFDFKTGGYKPVVQISTDGFNAYPEAVDLAFGPYAKYGVIIKEYRNASMIYTPSEMVGTKRTGRRGIEGRELFTICTSHVERLNCTQRVFLKRLNRLTLCFSARNLKIWKRILPCSRRTTTGAGKPECPERAERSGRQLA